MTDSDSLPMIVGLTGGIASGKSAVADEFEALGVPVLDTDQLAREVVEPGGDAVREIREAFGDDVLGEDGGLDRAAMRRLAFEDAGARNRLEAILHPRIGERLDRELARIRHQWCIAVVPLLVEAGWVDRVDRVLVVDVPPAVQLSRLMARDGLDGTGARRVLDAQASREDRLAVAHDVVNNTGSPDELRLLVQRLHVALEALAQQVP